MKNRSTEQLERMAHRFWQEQGRNDPEQRWYEEKYEALYRAFEKRHRRNTALQSDVADLLDAQGCVAEGECEFLFRLGLQMGLELGGLDLLRIEDV